VSGLPDLVEGDRALLFLDPVEGVYRTVELALGMFFEVAAGDRLLLLREPSLQLAAPADDGAGAGQPRGRRFRDADAFRRWIADRVAGVHRGPDYFVFEGPGHPGPVGVTFSQPDAHGCSRPGLPLRWKQFDQGESVGIVVQADGQPGVPGGGMAQVLAAMRAWNEDRRSRVDLVRSGLSEGPLPVRFDGTNSLTFEDPLGEVDGAFDPAVGGVLAYTWLTFRCSPASPPHGVRGEPQVEARELLEADMTTRKGYRLWLASTADPRRAHEQVMAHGFGHVLGLGHGCGPDSNGPCRLGRERQTLMKPQIGNGPIQGAELQRDDRNAVRALYPLTGPAGPIRPETPVGLTVAAISQTELEVRWQDRSDDETGFEVWERAVDTDFVRIATLPRDTASVVIENIPSATWRAYRIVATNDRGGSNPTPEVGGTTLAPVGDCVRDGDTVCLNRERFRVEIAPASVEGADAGAAVPLTNDTAYLWFFDAETIEVVVKVLDGCAVNQRFWVFAGGLTDAHFTMKVIDTETGVAATYHNPPGSAFQTVQDTDTFAACPQGDTFYGESRYLTPPDETSVTQDADDASPAATYPSIPDCLTKV